MEEKENRRAFNASQSQTTNTSRQSALPVTMVQIKVMNQRKIEAAK